MLSFLHFATLFLLLSGASAFQARLLASPATRRSVLVKATTSDDFDVQDESPVNSAATTNSGEKVTDLDKATFQIAKEYLATGIPADSETKEPQVGGFTMLV
jgi:hypothetical protein